MEDTWLFWHRLGLRLDRERRRLVTQGARTGLTAAEFRRFRRIEALEQRQRQCIDRVQDRLSAADLAARRGCDAYAPPGGHMSMLLPDYEEGARQMRAAGQQYRIEAPGNGRMVLYLTDAHGQIAVYDLPMECMVDIARDIRRVYRIILERAMQAGKDA